MIRYYKIFTMFLAARLFQVKQQKRYVSGLRNELSEFKSSLAQNKNVRLPKLPSDFWPKDFDGNINFYVTNQRRKLLTEVEILANFPSSMPTKKGIRVTGIGGEGKSTTAYALACRALAENYLTIYEV